MKWTFTNPDGLGDFILRLPWLFAMQKAGWELQLAALPPILELARIVGLSHHPLPLPFTPYSDFARSFRTPYQKVTQAIKAFSPDLLFLGPSEPSFFEEELVRTLPHLKIGGFVCQQSWWLSEGHQDPHQFAHRYHLQVPYNSHDPEPLRNQRGARALLGKEFLLEPFAFSPERHFPESSLLAPHLKKNSYILINPGYRSGDKFPGWGQKNWVTALKLLEKKTDLPFLFTGNQQEEDANTTIFSHLQYPECHQNLTGKIPNLEALLGLLKSSRAMIGKDGGTIHLASLLQKPLISVMGMGTWGRFFPVGTSAISLSAGVPCRGCSHRCPFQTPLCIEALQPEALLDAWEELKELPPKKGVVHSTFISASLQKTIRQRDVPSYVRDAVKERRSFLQKEHQKVLTSWSYALKKRFFYKKTLIVKKISAILKALFPINF